jgi:hypothetical protein
MDLRFSCDLLRLQHRPRLCFIRRPLAGASPGAALDRFVFLRMVGCRKRRRVPLLFCLLLLFDPGGIVCLGIERRRAGHPCVRGTVQRDRAERCTGAGPPRGQRRSDTYHISVRFWNHDRGFRRIRAPAQATAGVAEGNNQSVEPSLWSGSRQWCQSGPLAGVLWREFLRSCAAACDAYAALHDVSRVA